MLSSRAVSILLLLFWGFVYLRLKNRIITSKVYFGLLAIMASAGLFYDPLPLMGLTPTTYSLTYIVMFAFIMVVTVIPWLKFDGFMLNSPTFAVNTKKLKLLKTVYAVVIICSFFSIAYALPYAVVAWFMGADAVRASLVDGYIMPKSIFTTLASGISTFSPITIVLFYVSLLDNSLKKFSPFLLISSFSYTFIAMTVAGRDGFIYTPLTYLVLYFVFKDSYNKDVYKKIKKIGFFVVVFLIALISVFTLSRFGESTNNTDDLLYGSWGYIYQQPYVFDHIIDQFDGFYGFNRRLKFMQNIIPLAGNEYDSYTALNKYEYMFGTQFAEYYMISGFGSLIIGIIVYISLFYIQIKNRLKVKSIFPLLVVFVIYEHFTISGLFYFRLGGIDNEFFFYMAFLLLAKYMPNFVIIKKNGSVI